MHQYSHSHRRTRQAFRSITRIAKRLCEFRYRFSDRFLFSARSCAAYHWIVMTFTIVFVAISQTLYAEQTVEEYAAALQTAQTQLDGGDAPAAKSTLENTSPPRRGIEFDLISHLVDSRLNASHGDAIERLDHPDDVKVRYGLLNPVTKQVVFICQDGSLRRRSVIEEDKVFENLDHPDKSAVWRGAFSANGKRFVAAHGNGDIVVWDATQWERIHTVSLGEKPVIDLAVSADGKAFAATGSKFVELWREEDGSFGHVADLFDRLRFGNGIAFSPDGKLVATGGMFDIVIKNADDGTDVRKIQHASYTMGMCFSPDSKTIASAPRGNINKLLGLFQVNDGSNVFRQGPFAKYIAGMAFTPDGRRLVCTGCENRIRVFDTQTGVVVLDLPREECSAAPAISADGKLLTWSEKGGLYFIHLAD